MIRTTVIVLAVAFLSLLTLAGVSRRKPRVDSLDQWRVLRDARKAGLL